STSAEALATALAEAPARAPISAAACSREDAGTCTAACGQRLRSAGPARGARSVSRMRRARVGPTPSSSCSTRNQLTSSAGLSTSRSTARRSLTCAASRKRRPPYLTNGMPRRVSSSSSSSGALPVPNRTRLPPQLVPLPARGEPALAPPPRLLALVAGEAELGRQPPLSFGPQALGESQPILLGDRVCHREDRRA